MLLKGSCHCARVSYSVNSTHPYPFNLCYCSICRKTAGGGGYAINLAAHNASLKVEGESYISIYQAMLKDEELDEHTQSPCQRHFCSCCGSALWAWDPRWPELIHPFASAIDTVLPIAPAHTHLMLEFKAPWVEVLTGPEDLSFSRYPDESIAQWHQRHGLEK
ncbi:MAG: hypothetical protein ACI9SC_001597 [Gammaproteobacteria bacterium]|jgi:hypothetical protein